MATKLQAVQDELAQLKRMLAGLGIGAPAPLLASDKDRADYIEHGSEKHAVLLGLVKAEPDDESLYVVHDGYRLEDEITAYTHHHNPAQVALLTLRQKISELKAGKPPISTNAPPIWTPISREGETWSRVARGTV